MTTISSFDDLLTNAHNSDGKTVIIDGGLGTTLEEEFHAEYISHTPLWSSQVAIRDPELIIDAHLAFLRAGARIISTATFQCSYVTFERAGYSRENARRVMLKSVELADEARIRYYRERGNEDLRICIALSLGPYGAMLSPTQEFQGFYPPPYGPKAFTLGEDNINSYSPGSPHIEASIRALSAFHLERLEIFMNDSRTWDRIDCLAFETVSLSREILSIRHAVAFAYASSGTPVKPWWISCVFPDGTFPEISPPMSGKNLDLNTIVSALFIQSPALDCLAVDLPQPTGIGINCTDTRYLPRLIGELKDAVRIIRCHIKSMPWLLLYPNGGDTYDPTAGKWIPRTTSDGKSVLWTREMKQVLELVLDKSEHLDPLWAGLVLGGCCRVGPKEIQALAERMVD